MRTIAAPILFVLLVIVGPRGTAGHSQREHEIPPAKDQDYGPRFFEQLQHMFERYADGDVHHVFQTARPVPCTTLANDHSEWRDVAFFSGRRKFGNWYHANLNDVRADRAVYVFKGVCQDERATLQVTTSVPVSLRFPEGSAPPQDVPVRVNPPVKAFFNTDTKAYTFELPYLFRDKDAEGNSIYTFSPQHVSDRYLTNVISRWECKAVTEEFATYRFLICHTMLFDHEVVDIKPERDKPTYSFGVSSYAILSDGKPN